MVSATATVGLERTILPVYGLQANHVLAHPGIRQMRVKVFTILDAFSLALVTACLHTRCQRAALAQQ